MLGERDLIYYFDPQFEIMYNINIIIPLSTRLCISLFYVHSSGIKKKSFIQCKSLCITC